MRVTLPFFAVDLPDGFTIRSEYDPFSAVSEARRCEITLSPAAFREGADTAEAMAYLLGVYRDGFREMDPDVYFVAIHPPSTAARPVVGFVAIGSGEGPAPMLGACLIAARGEAIGANVHAVTLCVYQGSGSAAEADGFGRFCLSVLATLEVAPEAATANRALARGGKLDAARLYPFLVTRDYLAELNPDADAPALGHGLLLAFAEDNDGAARILFRDDCARLGFEGDVLARARANLVAALQARAVTLTVSRVEPGPSMLMFGPEWLASSCLFLPDLRAFAARHLGTDDLCACAPHRGCLAVFPRGDAAAHARIRAQIAAWEGTGRKPLSMGFFVLTTGGFEALAEADGPEA